MSEEKSKKISKEEKDDFRKLLDQDDFKAPRAGETVKGLVITASKAEIKLDINGILTGIVRGPELYEQDEEYADLKPGDEVEATVIEEENENGELELSFKCAGQEKAWSGLVNAYENKTIIQVDISDANRGGLLANFRQIPGFLPVSQLAPDNYPRVHGGDKSKILEKLKFLVGKKLNIKVIMLEENGEKIIFSEKAAWGESQQDLISKYKVGAIIEGVVTAVTDFGVFIGFDKNLEGLIHISELAWQRIDHPAELFKVGDKLKAEIISLENAKIFLSVKKLMQDPWHEAAKKYKAGQEVDGLILKINHFGLFVKLDNHIHGLAHISQLELAPKQKIGDKFKINQKYKFKVVSVEPRDHRLGLMFVKKKDEYIKSDETGNLESGIGEEENKKARRQEGKKTGKKKSEETVKQESKTTKKQESEKTAKQENKKIKNSLSNKDMEGKLKSKKSPSV